ncbi:MAG TPA: GNAT family acetyltransferase [Anaeromyxobacteraceae bacterium]|nr:GNAT family acetyltransferase [Anaeromyxobacteraceae bacterium]
MPAPSATAISSATSADVDAIVRLWALVFPEYGDPRAPQRAPRASVERKLAFGDGLFWVAERGGELVGTVMAGYDGHRGWIYSLGVHPSARRLGLGRELAVTAERALAALGCPKVNLQVFASNAAAQAFWRRAGWVEDAVLSFGKRVG